MVYEPNPKHKPVPTPGRRGSICPSLPQATSQSLLDGSVAFGRQRYASDGSNIYCAQCHDLGRDAWHGYPLNWSEVDPRVRSMLVEAGQVEQRTIRRSLRSAG